MGGCLDRDEDQKDEFIRIEDRLTETELFQFDVAEDETTKIRIHVREPGIAEVELVDPRDEQSVLSDTVEYSDSENENVYSPSLESDVVYQLNVTFDDNVVDITVASLR